MFRGPHIVWGRYGGLHVQVVISSLQQDMTLGGFSSLLPPCALSVKVANVCAVGSVVVTTNCGRGFRIFTLPPNN